VVGAVVQILKIQHSNVNICISNDFKVEKVVNYLIAEETAPTFVAVALPRLLACSMKAARIADALVAQLSLPSQFAPVNELKKKLQTSFKFYVQVCHSLSTTY
jgi:hypothetical protein